MKPLFRVWDSWMEVMLYYGDFFDKPLNTFNDERYTILRCSGVRDKNDWLIYKGDICQIIGHEEFRTITYDKGSFFMHQISTKDSWPLCWTPCPYEGMTSDEDWIKRDFTVVGNIYENPELLKYNDAPFIDRFCE